MTSKKTLHTTRWAAAIAQDTSKAAASVTMTALSMLPPRRKQQGDLALLLAACAAARDNGCAIEFIIAAPSRSHPATLRNHESAEWLNKQGFGTVLVPLPGLLHAKTALIDRATAWVGSGNLTHAAATHNHECWMRSTESNVVAELAIFHAELRG